MSTEKTTIDASCLSGPLPRLRVSPTTHSVLPDDNRPAQTELARYDDPRWVFAMRARLTLDSGKASDDVYERLIERGRAGGLNAFQANSIIGIIERANLRGGFDLIAHNEIMRVPGTTTSGVDSLSTRARWITFSALFVWALLIAGLMQIVA